MKMLAIKGREIIICPAVSVRGFHTLIISFYNNLKFSGDTNVSGIFSCTTIIK